MLDKSLLNEPLTLNSGPRLTPPSERLKIIIYREHNLFGAQTE